MFAAGCLLSALSALVYIAAGPVAHAHGLLELEGFVTDIPKGGIVAGAPAPAATNQRTASQESVLGWKSAHWRAIRDNTTAQLGDVPGSFRQYKAARQRRYRDARREAVAQTNFRKNLEFIVAENAKGTNPYVLGVTNFTDLSYEDFAKQYLMAPAAVPAELRRKQRRRRGRSLMADMATDYCYIHWGAASLNPLNKSVTSSVKNQGGCGSCWAFGAAASLESWVAMQNYTLDGGNMMDVSEQMLVDCSYSNKDGCGGGWPTAAWDYVIANKGLAPEAVKPYASGTTGKWSGACPAAKTPKALGSGIVKGYNWVMPQNDAGVVAALQTQPLFTAVAAGAEFQNYAGGAIVCNGTAVTHAVQTIGCGYILQNNAYVPVFIIKNQWSQYWGYGGYAYVLRTKEQYGTCALGFGAYTLS